MTAIEKINGLYEIAEFMDDQELTDALEFVAKLILKPDIPPQVATMELIRLQAIGVKLALKATWMANVDKSDRAKKNIYYTAAEQINLLCQTLKYNVRHVV